MITPLDIHNKFFKSQAFGGYNKEEVDLFLDKLAEDYEKTFKENIELKDKLNVLNEGLHHYKAMEETLQNTLIIAQNTSDDIKKNAYAKQDNIIKEAELKAAKIIADANEEAIRIKHEIEELKRSHAVFKARIESLLNAQAELLRSTFSSDYSDETSENE